MIDQTPVHIFLQSPGAVCALPHAGWRTLATMPCTEAFQCRQCTVMFRDPGLFMLKQTEG